MLIICKIRRNTFKTSFATLSNAKIVSTHQISTTPTRPPHTPPVVHCSSITLKEMFVTEVNSSKTNLVKPHLTLICTLNLFNQFTRATECEVQVRSCQAYLQCQVEFELGVLVFVEGGKPENPEKTFGARTRTNNKLNPHVTPDPGI